MSAKPGMCGRQRVARLMREAALRARPRRRAKPFDTGERALHMIAPNVLDRDFTAAAPNQITPCFLHDEDRAMSPCQPRHATPMPWLHRTLLQSNSTRLLA